MWSWVAVASLPACSLSSSHMWFLAVALLCRMLSSVYGREKEPLCNDLVQLSTCDVNGGVTQKSFSLGGEFIWYLPTLAFVWMSWCLTFRALGNVASLQRILCFLKPVPWPMFQLWGGFWPDFTNVVVPAQCVGLALPPQSLRLPSCCFVPASQRLHSCKQR